MHAYCTVLLSTYYKCGGSDTFWFWSLIWSNPTFHSVRSLFHILLSFSVKSNLGQAKIPNYSSNFQPFHFFEILDRVSENPWIRIRIRITEFTYGIDYVQRGLGLSLREVHLDQWSLTEVLRLHLEASGAFRGHNLQNWRYQQRGGFRLSDDPGFQFCRDEPQILGALNTQSVYELRQGSVFSPYRYFLL